MSLRDKLSKAKNQSQPNTGGSQKNEAGRSDARARVVTPEPEKSHPGENSEKKLFELSRHEAAVKKVVKRSATLADRITEDDMQAGMLALRNALKAENVIYDGASRQLVRNPDSKTQLAAFTLMMAYVEGTPVKRIAAVVADARSVEDRIHNLQESPEMANALRSIAGIGAAIEIDGEILDIEAEETVQETPSENEDVA